jgi:hypothetical protein
LSAATSPAWGAPLQRDDPRLQLRDRGVGRIHLTLMAQRQRGDQRERLATTGGG